MAKRNIVIINAYEISAFAARELPGGENAMKRSAAFAAALPDVAEVRYLTKSDTDAIEEAAHTVLAGPTAKALLDAFPDSGYDHIFYFYADCPLLDLGIASKMYDEHLRYLAHYSFADGYPYGLTPEIVSTEIVVKLRSLAQDVTEPLDRETLFRVIQKDINAFDIETQLAPTDQRMLRVSLSSDTSRNFTVLERIMAAGGTDAESATRIIDERPELLRSMPAFVAVQIVDGCPQRCGYCPFPEIGGAILEQRNEMALDHFKRIVDEVHAFADDAVIGISLWGEPSLHSQVEEIVGYAASVDGISVLIETSGIGWRDGVIESIISRCGESLTWIVSLDAIEPALYRTLRGTGFKEAKATADWLVEHAPEQSYVQAVRMEESEEALESFYRYWKERTERVIIQKYSTFGGILPQRKVTDLSPIQRFPCWHLKRDLHILIDGTVPICREDVRKTTAIGNVFDEPLTEIWERQGEWYTRHIAGDYPDLCRDCDEYYTFNY